MNAINCFFMHGNQHALNEVIKGREKANMLQELISD